ncbi:transmembrane protein 168 [Plakobranchus ocellatus]|uniref:Transmembrane protein 168 n=1 Tax=Plakobranchus ocellatus TaxID=259542 RepID=A0AAV3ZGE9_9GAST|nr:transmembrane protein 168 [Plakobranchus ocellatus]
MNAPVKPLWLMRKRLQHVPHNLKAFGLTVCSKAKYSTVHLSEKAVAAMMQAQKTNLTIQHLKYVPEIILIAALGIGLYTQWTYTEDATVSVIGILGAFVFAVSCALRYYLGYQDLGRALFHVWVGCLTGILALTNHLELQYMTLEEVMEAMFMSSMVLGWCWNLIERALKLKPVEAKLLTVSEGLESLGFIIASLATGLDSIALSMFTLAYIFHISAMRLKSFMGLISFLGFIFVGIFMFFPSLEVKPNIYALTCFVGRHAFQSVVDFEFSGLSMIDRWRSFFDKSRLFRYLCVLMTFCLEIVFLIVVGHRTSKHKEWYIVFVMFIVVAVFWLMFHLMVFLTLWKFMGKITECNASANEELSFNRIMAAKGLRHFGLVTQRIMLFSLLLTLGVFILGFETRTSYSLALTFLVLPIEAATLSLFWELGDNIGGTCTGYAVIAPVTSLRQGAGAQLLTSSSVHDISARGTATLAQLQQLFTYHMIQNFGCDYSSSGLELDNLRSKLRAFFDRCTADGPRFDTYLLYYSGDVYDSGDWALSDNKSLSLSMLLSWWQEQDKNSGSRLILVLDTESSFKWAHMAASVKESFLAVQTCRYISRPESAEAGERCWVGSFTQAYVRFNNCDHKKQDSNRLGAAKPLTEQEIVGLDWSSKQRPLRAMYRVSRSWSNFSFHQPGPQEVGEYWRATFPRIMSPLLKCLNLPESTAGSLGGPIPCLGCSGCIVRWLRWLQMSCLPPRQLDTGHGLQLINT